MTPGACLLVLLAGSGLASGNEDEAALAFQARVQAYVTVRDEHPGVREGAIFAAPVARLFRAAVGDLLSPADFAALGRQTRCASDAHVNHPLPRGASHFILPRLLYRFPPLPPGIEYRVVNADLVLWDVDADLVIDVLRDLFAVPSDASGGPRADRDRSAATT
jgi:hypothetical protein